MMKPQTLKGFRDFLPEESRKRQYVINTLKQVFASFGFGPLETPALEYEEILTGKYGEEGDKLMYRFEDNGGRRVALRYDQTVPLSRVVAQYQNALTFPFKRYQIQPVWRAENTQKGRYREFLQCDIDTVGTSSPAADAEILAIITEAFKRLGLTIVIKINDRSLLEGIEPKYLATIDKLQKIGEEDVVKELQAKGLSEDDAKDLLSKFKNFKPTNNLQAIRKLYEQMGYSPETLEFDPLMVRGLDYYTGIILEVVLQADRTSSSLGGGGRYDNLVGMFAGRQFPAVGFAFGFDRIINVMEESNLFPNDLQKTKVLVTVFSTDLQEKSASVSSSLRSQGISTELYLDDSAKMEKQLKYANQKNIPYVIIIGPDEAAKQVVQLKNMQTREQREVPLDGLVNLLQ